MFKALCRAIGYLHHRCAGHVTTPVELPIELREASHRLHNEVTILHGQMIKVRREADALNDLVTEMRGDHTQ